MQPTINIQKKFNFLILLLAVSFVLYIVEIFDWALPYEIFTSITLALIYFGAIGSFVLTIIEATKHKQLPSKLSISIFMIFLMAYVIIYGNRNGLFWGKKIIESVFIDERSRLDLDLYENGKFLIYSNWLFGESRLEGTYKLVGDTIIFDKPPVTNKNFIAQRIIIDRTAEKIYFMKGNDGSYDKSFYYFKIDF